MIPIKNQKYIITTNDYGDFTDWGIGEFTGETQKDGDNVYYEIKFNPYEIGFFRDSEIKSLNG